MYVKLAWAEIGTLQATQEHNLTPRMMHVSVWYHHNTIHYAWGTDKYLNGQSLFPAANCLICSPNWRIAEQQEAKTVVYSPHFWYIYSSWQDMVTGIYMHVLLRVYTHNCFLVCDFLLLLLYCLLMCIDSERSLYTNALSSLDNGKWTGSQKAHY